MNATKSNETSWKHDALEKNQRKRSIRIWKKSVRESSQKIENLTNEIEHLKDAEHSNDLLKQQNKIKKKDQ